MSSIPAKKSLVSPGRKPMISREDIIAAALKLLGPSRSVSTLSLREVAREAGIQYVVTDLRTVDVQFVIPQPADVGPSGTHLVSEREDLAEVRSGRHLAWLREPAPRP